MNQIQAPMLRRWWTEVMSGHRIGGQPLTIDNMAKKAGFQVVAMSAHVSNLVDDLAARYTPGQLIECAPLPCEIGFIDASNTKHSGLHQVFFTIAEIRQSDVPHLPFVNTVVSVFSAHPKTGSIIGMASYPWTKDEGLMCLKGWYEKYETGGPAGLSEQLYAEIHHKASRIFTAACAVLAAPGVTATTERRKLSWAQRYREPCPHVEYRCVDLDVDLMGSARGSVNEGGGTPKALHHVRGHLRLVEKGLVTVRPHWRGSSVYGTILKDVNAKRGTED